MMIQNQTNFMHQSYFFRWLSEQDQSQYFMTESLNSMIPEVEVKKQDSVKKCGVIIVAPTSASDSTDEIPKETDDEIVVLRTRRGKIIRKQISQVRQKDDKDPNFNPKKQKKNRNVLSNLVHHLLKYILEAPFVASKVKKIREIHELTISQQEFFVIIQAVENSYKGYVTQKNLKNLWKGDIKGLDEKISRRTLKEFSKIIRILSSQFYRGNCKNSILFSNKLSMESKNLHFNGLFEIGQLLFATKQDSQAPEKLN